MPDLTPDELQVNYYKATRPDGTDFRTGTIDYAAALASGAVVRHPSSETMVPNDAATYLSVSTEPADCTGFRWPCRLFRIEPEGDVLDNLDYPHKCACLALRVVEELPAHLALGPNGEQLAAFIERCGRLTPDEAKRLAAAGAAAWDAAWDAAIAAARDAAWAAAWAAAGAAAWDAAWALLVRDRITPDQFDTLTKPWRDAGLALTREED